jgi:hypothetical protein
LVFSEVAAVRGGLARVAVVAAASATAVAVAAGPAWAPKYILGASAFGTCSVSDARFQGDFTVHSFFASPTGDLMAVALVGGSCNAGGEVVAVVTHGLYEYPVAMTASCDATSAAVEFRPGAATVGATLGDDPKTGEPVKLTLDLAPTTVVDRTWSADESKSVRGKLCAIAHMAGHRSAGDLAAALNSLTMV